MAKERAAGRSPAQLRRAELITEVERLEAELHQTQAALRSHQHLISQVYHHAKVRCWTWDAASQRVTHVIPIEDDSGRDLPVIPLVGDYLDAVHPDDRARVAAAYARADSEGAAIDIEYRLRATDGTWRHLHEKGESLRDARGQVVSQEGVVQDVTALKRVAANLRAREELLQRIIDNVPAGITLKNRDGQFVLINRVFEDWYGLERGEALDKTARDLFPAGVAERREEQDRRALRPGEITEQEYEEVFADGRSHRLSVVKFPVPDAHKGLSGIGTIVLDITERRQAEEALRARETWLSAILDNAPMAIFLKDGHGRYIVANERFLDNFSRRTRASRRNVEGLRLRDLIPEQYIAEAEQDDRAIHETGKPIEKEFRDRTQSGERIYRHIKVPIRDGENRVIGVCGFEVDITDLKQAEERLRVSQRIMRAVIDTVPAAINVKDRNGRFLLVNDALAKVYDLTPDEALEQWTSWESKISDSLYNSDYVRAEDERVFATGNPIPFGEYSYDVGGRREVWLSTKLPIFDEAGEVKYVLTVAFDITERKETEQQLRQAQKMEAIGQLTGGVAHDFNNLLAVILGNLELAEERAQQEPALRTHLEKALAACERGAKLTQQLLAFSRRQSLRPEPLDARALVSGVVDLLKRTLGETIEIEMINDDDLWLCEVDRAQMESAILNLALNARDAMPNGGRLVIETANARLGDERAAAQLEVRPGGYVVISIRDNGTGMPARVKERIFEPFFTTKEVGRGTGLGLSMVYGFVKQSGGHILVDSEVGRGTSFKIYLPQASGDAAGQTVAEPLQPGWLGRGETVLVVEDDTDLRNLVVSQLRGLGYGVHEAAGAEGALTLLASEPVDLVLSDFDLRGVMDGRALEAEAARRHAGLKFLFMTGHRDSAGAWPKVGGPAPALLEKPFRKTDLARAVRGLLDR